jgi:hypothetical protein
MNRGEFKKDTVNTEPSAVAPDAIVNFGNSPGKTAYQ